MEVEAVKVVKFVVMFVARIFRKDPNFCIDSSIDTNVWCPEMEKF